MSNCGISCNAVQQIRQNCSHQSLLFGRKWRKKRNGFTDDRQKMINYHRLKGRIEKVTVTRGWVFMWDRTCNWRFVENQFHDLWCLKKTQWQQDTKQLTYKDHVKKLRLLHSHFLKFTWKDPLKCWRQINCRKWQI